MEAGWSPYAAQLVTLHPWRDHTTGCARGIANSPQQSAACSLQPAAFWAQSPLGLLYPLIRVYKVFSPVIYTMWYLHDQRARGYLLISTEGKFGTLNGLLSWHKIHTKQSLVIKPESAIFKFTPVYRSIMAFEDIFERISIDLHATPINYDDQ